MNYITTAEAGRLLGLNVRRISKLCKAGDIQGAQKFGRDWMIPYPPVRKPVKRAGRPKAED